MREYVTCGAIDCGNGWSDIVVEPITGDTICCNDLLGDSLFSNISVADPMPFENEEAIRKVCEHFNCDGVIMSASYLITLKDDVASYRNYLDNTKVEHRVEYDLCQEYVFDRD